MWILACATFGSLLHGRNKEAWISGAGEREETRKDVMQAIGLGLAVQKRAKETTRQAPEATVSLAINGCLSSKVIKTGCSISYATKRGASRFTRPYS